MFEFLFDLLRFLKFMVVVAFIGNPVTLTSSPVNMEAGSRLVFEPEKPLRVIADGYLSIYVTSMQPAYADGLHSTRKWADETFGERHISAILVNTSTNEEVKVDQYGLSYNSTSSRLKVFNDRGLEHGKTYDKIIVETDVELRGVTMTWSSWSL